MLRAVALLAAVMVLQGMTAHALLERSVCPSACPDDGSNDGCSGTSDEALAAFRVAMAHVPSPKLHRLYAPELAIAPSPAPDEILHVPKPLLA